jgi:DinB superfamily
VASRSIDASARPNEEPNERHSQRGTMVAMSHLLVDRPGDATYHQVVTAVEELVAILEDAFAAKGIEETGESQSMLGNLATVPDPLWTAVPDGGERTIASIVVHVGGCLVMYDEYAFGPGRKQWDDPDLVPWTREDAPMTDAIAWMTDAHRRFVDHVAALADDQLGEPRLANWGEMVPTRWLISAIATHSSYHAGEINHVRSLLQHDDRWLWG